VFAILDSDHSKAHVLQELRVIARVTSRGDRVIVEDRCDAVLLLLLLLLLLLPLYRHPPAAT